MVQVQVRVPYSIIKFSSCAAFAYGSGVFLQAGQSWNRNNMADFIIGRLLNNKYPVGTKIMVLPVRVAKPDPVESGPFWPDLENFHRIRILSVLWLCKVV